MASSTCGTVTAAAEPPGLFDASMQTNAYVPNSRWYPGFGAMTKTQDTARLQVEHPELPMVADYKAASPVVTVIGNRLSALVRIFNQGSAWRLAFFEYTARSGTTQRQRVLRRIDASAS